MIFRYQVTEIDGHGISVRHLDKHGADGWELCYVERTHATIGGNGKMPVTHFYWKKRMPEDRVEQDRTKRPAPGGWVRPEDFVPPKVEPEIKTREAMALEH